MKRFSFESKKPEKLRNKRTNVELDSNKYSDDLTLDSGIAGSYKEPLENFEQKEETIVTAVYGNRQNFMSFSPNSFIGLSHESSSFTEVSDDDEKYPVQRKVIIFELICFFVVIFF